MEKAKRAFCALILLLLSGTGAFAGTAVPASAGPGLRITGLRCEYASEPIGLDVPSPQLSWRVESSRRGVFQSAYRIIVARSGEELARDEGVWDSGRNASSQSAGVRYEGPALSSRQRYFWKVKIWTTDGRESEWSAPATFEMGLLG